MAQESIHDYQQTIEKFRDLVTKLQVSFVTRGKI